MTLNLKNVKSSRDEKALIFAADFPGVSWFLTPSTVKEVQEDYSTLASYLGLTLLLVITVDHFTVYLFPLGKR